MTLLYNSPLIAIRYRIKLGIIYIFYKSRIYSIFKNKSSYGNYIYDKYINNNNKIIYRCVISFYYYNEDWHEVYFKYRNIEILLDQRGSPSKRYNSITINNIRITINDDIADIIINLVRSKIHRVFKK
jgi:hypothetical protein